MVTDSLGSMSKVVPSTLKSDHVWLFVKHGQHAKYKGALHLSRRQAISLMEELSQALGEYDEHN